MKRNMPNYVANIARGDIEIIDELFEKYYDEFYTFYFVIKEHTDLIRSIKFKKKMDVFRLEIKVDNKLDKLKFSQSIRDHAPSNMKIKTKPDHIVVIVHKK